MRVLLLLCLVVSAATPAAHAQTPQQDSLEALLEAAGAGDVDRVRALLAYGVDLHAGVSADRPATPLHRAAEAGRAEVIDMLLAAGANVNAGDVVGASPLHWAAQSGNRAIVELLLARGADAGNATDGGVTALHYVAESEAPGAWDVAEMLLRNGVPVNEQDFEGATPLHYAARAGRRDIAERLVAAGADLTSLDYNATTPARYARQHGHVRLAMFLITGLPEAPRDDSRVVATVSLEPQRADELIWLTSDVTPLAYREGRWLVALATSHSGIEGTEPTCAYRAPWSGEPVDGGMRLEEWSIVDGVARAIDTVALAAQVEGAAEQCTPQADIERRYEEATRQLAGRVELDDAVWTLDTLPGTFTFGGRSLRLRVERANVEDRERTLACVSWNESARERCLAVLTSPDDSYQDRVRPTVAVVHGGAVSIFGLRRYGDRWGVPSWAGVWPAVNAVYLGRLPLAPAESDPASGAAPCNAWAYENDPDPAGLNVRAEPTSSSSIVFVIPGDVETQNRVRVTDHREGWMRISTVEIGVPHNERKPLDGWVWGRLLAVDPRGIDPVALHVEPRRDAEIVARADRQLSLAGCSGQWLEVRNPAGRRGWLAPEDQCANAVTTCP
ncbi:MAG: ankyrin repeat domain-containing protein [Gemmatimonadales bacterium]|jgi:ankyrin repeat protein